MKIFKWIRSKFHNSKPAKPLFPRTFVVNVRVEHPQIVGDAIIKTRMAIDANSKQHARERLQKELRLIIGNARKV